MDEATRSNFIWDAIEQDLSEGRYQEIHTRFPPEPNGYMHIGHCKALIMDFLTAEKFHGKCNLRFDDTNPAKEDTEYVENIKKRETRQKNATELALKRMNDNGKCCRKRNTNRKRHESLNDVNIICSYSS